MLFAFATLAIRAPIIIAIVITVIIVIIRPSTCVFIFWQGKEACCNTTAGERDTAYRTYTSGGVAVPLR